MASRAHHWKPTNAVKIATAVQRQRDREGMSARIISATPKVPRSGAYQGAIRILAANVSKNMSAGPAIARNTPRSSKDEILLTADDVAVKTAEAHKAKGAPPFESEMRGATVVA